MKGNSRIYPLERRTTDKAIAKVPHTPIDELPSIVARGDEDAMDVLQMTTPPEPAPVRVSDVEVVIPMPPVPMNSPDRQIHNELKNEPHNERPMDRVDIAIKRLEIKLNGDIGYAWWNKYVAAAFWSNVSLPLNLTITLLTALTTVQTTTENLLPRDSYVALSIMTLVISVLNTFFRPHAQMMESIKIMSKWTEFGNKFESIYYGDTQPQKTRLKDYQSLQNEINVYENSESPESRNFLTDMIHMLLSRCCMKRRDMWLPPSDADEV